MAKIKSWTFQQHYSHCWWMDIMTILVFDGHLQLSIFMISNGFYKHDHNLQLQGQSYKSHSNM
jgi:hypothetical protein